MYKKIVKMWELKNGIMHQRNWKLNHKTEKDF